MKICLKRSPTGNAKCGKIQKQDSFQPSHIDNDNDKTPTHPCLLHIVEGYERSIMIMRKYKGYERNIMIMRKYEGYERSTKVGRKNKVMKKV